MSVTALPRITLRDRAAEALRDAVLSGRLLPGTAVVEVTLARELGISRAPLREAIRQLLEEGLLAQARAWGGVTVAPVDAKVAGELYTLRTTLEIFAFEQLWDRRDLAFRAELHRRLAILTKAIDLADDPATIQAELALHSLVYEASGHGLLLSTWEGLRGRLQLYWAAHHAAHGRPGPRRDAHDDYVRYALGKDLEAMRVELRAHMRRGLETVLQFLTTQPTQKEAP
ncbi:GntR family transcriptional regulator [Falsiroseomonas sp.]|jgi:DNA-binding GntR family transcriptional regulator|uniref:GntR family transcriptional regulator n=1 Tax=Falsiroseomonas sp. TaxID=2870721 RepID=UPI0034A3EF15